MYVFRLSIVLCLLLAAPARAEDPQSWDAVGRITVGGQADRARCSGVLVAPDAVLTAAHCVSQYREAGPSRIRRLVFVAGWDGPDIAGAAVASSVTIDPAWVRGQQVLPNIRHDIALVRLSEPMVGITPLPLARVPGFDQDLTLSGYLNSMPEHVPVTRPDCLFEKPFDGLLLVGCPVASGFSGAPVLAGDPAAPAVVAIVAAKSPFGGYAVVPPDWVFEALSP